MIRSGPARSLLLGLFFALARGGKLGEAILAQLDEPDGKIKGHIGQEWWKVMADSMLAHADKDRSGKLDREELEGQSAVMLLRSQEWDFFSAADTNHDNYVDLDELEAYWQHPAAEGDAYRGKRNPVPNIFEYCDADGDGALTKACCPRCLVSSWRTAVLLITSL